MKAATAGAVGLALAPARAAAELPPEVLYNGIRLPRRWPPPLQSLSRVPATPPYLLSPPAVIPIDVGRQLFVDDFLIQATTLTRRFHAATYHPKSPLLSPLTAWEKFDSTADRTGQRSNPAAMPFSDGVFYDPHDRLFKMWYMGGYTGSTCLVLSEDGISWRRPAFDVKPGTNIVLTGTYRDSNTIWLDHEDPAPGERFKMAVWYDRYLLLYASPDGIHWQPRGKSGPTGDRTTFFYNAFRRKWVFSLRDEIDGIGRLRRYWEHDRFFEGVNWRAGEPSLWTSADSADPQRDDYRIAPQLYNLDAVSYESVLLGLFSIWRGEPRDREKVNEVCVGFSRDGFHWSRPDRAPFIPVSEHVGDWNWANVQSAGGCCLVVGDELYFYVSGRSGVPGTDLPGISRTGLATIRRDGFASMDLASPESAPVRQDARLGRGTLLTRPVRFTGACLFVNADLGGGELRASVEDEQGQPLPNLALADCVPAHGNSTALHVRWKDDAALARVTGRPVRVRLQITHGRLYAFWIAPSSAGASRGFVAAGGPGFSGPRDTAGRVPA